MFEAISSFPAAGSSTVEVLAAEPTATPDFVTLSIGDDEAALLEPFDVAAVFDSLILSSSTTGADWVSARAVTLETCALREPLCKTRYPPTPLKTSTGVPRFPNGRQ